jgi:hypothetical protein
MSCSGRTSGRAARTVDARSSRPRVESILGRVALQDDLAAAAVSAAAFADEGERVDAVLAAEPSTGRRVYLCAFAAGDERRWLVIDGDAPVTSRNVVREVVALTALCEVVGEAVGDEPPRLASPAYLDEHGAPDVVAAAFVAVESLTEEVEAAYKRELE